MKKLKLALHWQILIGLALGVVFGLIFPTTSYQLTKQSLADLQTKNLPAKTIEAIRPLVDKAPQPEAEFLLELERLMGKPAMAKYDKVVLEVSGYNPYLPYVSWLGALFMRALKMVIIPLILSSIISGITNIGNSENLGRLGLKTMGYYLTTSLLAIVTGLLFVNVLKPGEGMGMKEVGEDITAMDVSFRDKLVSIIPENIVQAMVETDMLAIIFFAVLFGFFITRVSDQYKTLMTNFFNAMFEVMMKVTMFIIRFTPLGVFGIVAVVVAENANHLGELISSMGLYMVAVFGALAVHAIITLPTLLRTVGKVRPFLHFKAMRSALLTAWSTSSSSATLSLTMESVERRSGVSNKISSFTLPLGATINMDGTALYECIAVMFIAQAYGYDMSLMQQVIIVFTALLASIGAAGIPMAGLVMISIILTAVGLPLEGVGLILAVDRLLDMFRTATNVWSDSCGAVLIAKSEGESLNVESRAPLPKEK